MLEKWRVMLSDNFALNDINIYRPHRGSIQRITATKKNAINISSHMDRQWIGGVGDQLWVLTADLRGINLPEFSPVVLHHIPLNLVLGTLERSVAEPI